MAPAPTTGQQELTRIETALIALLHMEAHRPNYHLRELRETPVDFFQPAMAVYVSDRWRALNLPRRHLDPWLFGWNTQEERLFTPDPALLLTPVHQLLGTRAAICFCGLDTDYLLRYQSYRRLRFLPQPYRCRVPQALLYACEHSDIFPDGREVYQQSLHGWNPRRNLYVPIGIDGESHRAHLGFSPHSHERSLDVNDKTAMVVVASMIEDTQQRWKVRVSEVSSVWLSTDGPGMHALADLRDDPRTATGRRSPLLHWVAAHLRRKRESNDVVEVRRHLRGITTFQLGTVTIDIQEPQKTPQVTR